MNALDRTPPLTGEPAAPARASLRPGAIHRLGMYTSVRLTVGGPAPATVSVEGDIDLARADELTDVLCATLEDHPQGIELDLASVRFIDCRGLRVLLTAQASARRHGRHFAVGAHSPSVARLLDMTDTRSLLTAPR